MAELQLNCSVTVALAPDEELFVVGNLEGLGCWERSKALSLVEVEGSKRCMFSSKVQVDPSTGVPILFRYFRTRRMTKNTDGDSFILVTWEVGPARQLELCKQPKTVHVVNSTYGSRPDRYHALDDGYLMNQSEIRVRLIPGAVTFLKSKYSTGVRLKLEAMDLRFKDMSVDVEDGVPASLQYASHTQPMYAIINQPKLSAFIPFDETGILYDPQSHYVFKVQSLCIKSFGLKLSFYDDSQPDVLIGSSFLLIKKPYFDKTVPIIGTKGAPIGELIAHHMMIHPLQMDNHPTMQYAHGRHWKHRGTLDVGHRGMGNSYQKKLAKCAIVRENTIASLKGAASMGAAFVEFDVQLSKDLVPVVYHDFTVAISLQRRDFSPSRNSSRTAFSDDSTTNSSSFETSDGHELYELPVKDLNLSQLHMLRLSHITEMEDPKSGRINDENVPENQPFPMLRQVFHELPSNVGFNIEIKYPIFDKEGQSECPHYPERNAYLDKVLKCVLEHAGLRRIVFSCFDPDVCTMLKLKQSVYPVLYLLETQSTYCPFVHYYPDISDVAVGFANSEKILGIDVQASDLENNIDIFHTCRQYGLITFVWGDTLASHTTRDYFQKLGVEGMIYDRLPQNSLAAKVLEKWPRKSSFMIDRKEKKGIVAAMGS